MDDELGNLMYYDKRELCKDQKRFEQGRETFESKCIWSHWNVAMAIFHDTWGDRKLSYL